MKRVLLLVSLAGVSACEQRDPLYCGTHMDDPRCAEGDAGVPEGFYVITGRVNGLTGSGLVLRNNNSDDKQVSSSGSFSFATPVPMGSTYDVTVGTQPTNPSETCTVASGTGTANSDVSDVVVTCAPAAYTIGGNVAGLSGGNVVLTNNGGDAKTITASGPFTFTTPVQSGQPYDVAIQSQSGGQSCSIVANQGTVGSGPITTVVVVCGTNLFTVGGSPPQGGVTGINGAVKLHNGNDTITVNATGAFAFPTPIMGGGTLPYSVTVSQQPAYPPAAQTCTVSNGAGTVGTANVTNVGVACTTESFTVGGMVSGLIGGTLVLKKGTETVSLTADGAFTFVTPVQSGTTYSVSVMTNPTGLKCTVSNGSGTAQNSNITNVSVSCADAGVQCGTDYCNAFEVCCDPAGNESCRFSFQCQGVEMSCDDKAECSTGKICCAQRQNGNLTLERVSCETSCASVSNGLQLCNPLVTNECTSGTCQPWTDLPGYYACQ